jgi:hypothetical protein
MPGNLDNEVIFKKAFTNKTVFKAFGYPFKVGRFVGQTVYPETSGALPLPHEY